MKTIFFYAAIAALVLFLAALAGLAYLAATTGAASDFGRGQSLSACPIDKPRCVSSLNSQADFKADAFGVNAPAAEAMAKLKAAVLSLGRVEVVFEDATHLEVTFKTALMRFRDDARFQLDVDRQRIDFVSSSRVGYSDLGVNRKRIEQIRAAYQAP